MPKSYLRANQPRPTPGSTPNPEQLAWLNRRLEVIASELRTCTVPKLRRLYLAEMRIILDELDSMIERAGTNLEIG
jgi:hypothetical protein